MTANVRTYFSNPPIGACEKIPRQQSELGLMKNRTPLVSHVPPLFISGVIHPFLVVVLLLGGDELPALVFSLTKVYVPCLAFWCLCINVKLPHP